jgi:hypothetical protein
MVHRARWLITAGVLLLAGVVLALVPVSGTFDSERFHCGTPFHYDNSEGYAGSEGFADCTRRREALRYPAGGLLLVGLGFGAFAFARSRSRAAQETRAVR